MGALLGALQRLHRHRARQRAAADRPSAHGDVETAANEIALIEPPGFLMLNYGRNTFLVTLARPHRLRRIVGCAVVHAVADMIANVFQRRTTGSVVCPSCGSLVGVRDDKCYTCGRSNPGLWGFGPVLRQLGADFGFAPVVVGACVTL